MNRRMYGILSIAGGCLVLLALAVRWSPQVQGSALVTLALLFLGLLMLALRKGAGSSITRPGAAAGQETSFAGLVVSRGLDLGVVIGLAGGALTAVLWSILDDGHRLLALVVGGPIFLSGVAIILYRVWLIVLARQRNDRN